MPFIGPQQTFIGPRLNPQYPVSSIGSKARNPANNFRAPSNTLPSNQLATPSAANPVNPSDKAFSNPNDFFAASGAKNFGNVEEIGQGGAPTGQFYKFKNNPTVFQNSQFGTSSPIVKSASTSSTGSTSTQSVPRNPFLTNTTPQGQYTPPNQGTTGVSQGGLIGNLINMAQNETPQVKAARSNLEQLQREYAKQTSNLEGSPIDLSLATGQQGILNRLFAAKQAAGQTALSNALTSQGQQIGATQAAGTLNAPITGVPYGTQTISPSQPTTGTPYGQSTTSGAMNINSLIGQRPSPSNPSITEYYNTQTGQGFTNPQELANFVNQQLPGSNATPQNVFDLLKSGNLGGGGLGGGTLNPLNNVSSIAQQVISGQLSPSQAYAMGGNVQNWQGLLNSELQRLSPGFDTASAEANYAAKQGSTQGFVQQKNTWNVALNQAKNLQDQLNSVLLNAGANPSNFNAMNALLKNIAGQTSNPIYKALDNYLNELAATYAQILTPADGNYTDLVRSTARGMLDGTMQWDSLQKVLQQVDLAAQAKINAIPISANISGLTGSSGSSGSDWPGF